MSTALDQKICSIYFGIKYRCGNKKNIAYHNYGGKGVKNLITKKELKKLWIRDRACRMKCPSIDRIDSDGNYCLKNCRFIERNENTRRAHLGKKRSTKKTKSIYSTIAISVPKLLKKRYIESCEKLRIKGRYVLLEAINGIIKEASNRD